MNDEVDPLLKNIVGVQSDSVRFLPDDPVKQLIDRRYSVHTDASAWERSHQRVTKVANLSGWGITKITDAGTADRTLAKRSSADLLDRMSDLFRKIVTFWSPAEARQASEYMKNMEVEKFAAMCEAAVGRAR